LKIRSFDFLVYLPDGQMLITEIRGRKFRGTSLAKLTGLENWVTTDDIEGLQWWKGVFTDAAGAVFVFVYMLENVDIESDGREIYDYGSNRYVFLTVTVDDYCSHMSIRSPRWQTVTLPADSFRQCAVSLEQLLLRRES